MADAFRDAIARTFNADGEGWSLTDADAILAMPEMEAIKEALFVNYDFYDKPHELMASDGLPQSVIDWVLS